MTQPPYPIDTATTEHHVWGGTRVGSRISLPTHRALL